MEGVARINGHATQAAAPPPFARLIETEVIPRLLLACRDAAQPTRPGPAHAATLARLALAADPAAARLQVAALADAGVGAEALLCDLIAPAARRLGEMWREDSADFSDVAIAMARLTTAARSVDAPTRAAPAAPAGLIATPSAERHTLGAMIFARLLRLQGWRVVERPGADADALAAEIAATSPALVGLSVSCDRGFGELAGTVARLRAAGGQPLTIALGGPACAADPGLAARVGADFGCADGREGALRARAHLPEAARRATRA